MRIISPFKDYYDCMCRYSDDHTTLFKRIPEKSTIDINGGFYRDGVVIGVGNSLYPMIRMLRFNKNGYVPFESRDIASYCFDKKTAVNYYSSTYTKNSISKFFDYFRDSSVAESLTMKYGPVFSLSYWREDDKYNDAGRNGYGKNLKTDLYLDKNICLESFGFAKILPPVMAYNEIYKYIINQAQPAIEMPVFDDETMAEIHGFNRKTSFRKPRA